MKILGLALALFGGFILLIGLVGSVVTLTSSYASNVCARAAADSEKLAAAKRDCDYSQYEYERNKCLDKAKFSYETPESCANAKSFMNKQLIIFGVLPSVFGVFLAGVGLLILIVKRKKTMA